MEIKKNEAHNDTNFIINQQILSNIIQLVGKCPACDDGGMLSTSVNIAKKKGLAQEIKVWHRRLWFGTGD